MLHKCSADSVYIFSPSFNTDSTYASCWDYLRRELGTDYDQHVYDKPKLEVIKEIIAKQQKAKKMNDDARFWTVYKEDIPDPETSFSWGSTGNGMVSKQTTQLPIKRYFVLMDDCLMHLKSSMSDISLVSTWTRHSEITMCWVAQIYKRLPSSIRSMIDVMVMFYMYPLQERAFDDLFNKQDLRLFTDWYKSAIINGPRYSFVIIDKRAKLDGDDCNILYENGDTHERMYIDV